MYKKVFRTDSPEASDVCPIPLVRLRLSKREGLQSELKCEL